MSILKTMGAALTGIAMLASLSWAADWVNGVVRRVDSAGGKVTIKHEEIKDLQMPAMTMVFTVKSPNLVESLKRGQKVRFKASDLGGGKLQLEAIEAIAQP